MRRKPAVHDLCVRASDGWLHAVVRRRAPDGRGAGGKLLQQGVGGRIQTTGVAGAFACAHAGGVPDGLTAWLRDGWLCHAGSRADVPTVWATDGSL